MSNAKYQQPEDSPTPEITDEEIRRHVVRFSRDMTEIKTALIGNDLGTEGIVPRLGKVEEKTNNTARLLNVLAGVLVLFSLCIAFLKDLRTFLFHP